MNKDLDERIVPKGQYRDALNIQISTSDSDSGGLGNIGTVQNLKGNTQTTTTSATVGHDDKKSKIIASISDEGNGSFIIIFAQPMTDTDYIIAGHTSSENTNGNRGSNGFHSLNTQASGAHIFSAYGSTDNSGGGAHDNAIVAVSIFGN